MIYTVKVYRAMYRDDVPVQITVNGVYDPIALELILRDTHGRSTYERVRAFADKHTGMGQLSCWWSEAVHLSGATTESTLCVELTLGTTEEYMQMGFDRVQAGALAIHACGVRATARTLAQ